MSELTIQIEKMSCGNCLETVKTALEELDGVIHADVHLNDKTATVEYDPAKVDKNKMAIAVEDKGYVVLG
ncbi:heavy-metal-associated domain-containing protein [Bacillus sp. FJAT-45037]|uniref:heavy-metal-associated domain-containing protein n=1 Tax=Bacillus sp. FJAT-45037 TaxID=2011007 RepID=UPI000C239176|nr:cation transporter [Bacillus sp. FJAT-45037]